MRENITTKSTKDTKGNQIEKKLRDLRVLRGRKILPHVTKADGLAGQVPRLQLSFGVWLGSWKQTSRGPLALTEGFVVSSLRSEHSELRTAERAGPPRLSFNPHFS